MTYEPLICGRCGTQARDADVRSTIANLAREARRDGRPHTPPDFAVEARCRPCRELNRQNPERSTSR